MSSPVAEPTSPYLRYAERMIALCEPLRGLDAAGLADRRLCRARWARAGLVGALEPDLVEEREARRRAGLRLALFPGSVEPERRTAIDARIRFAGVRAFALLGRELQDAEVAHG